MRKSAIMLSVHAGFPGGSFAYGVFSAGTKIVVLFIMRVGDLMYAGFDQIWAMQNPLTVSVCEIIDTYVYKLGMESRKFSEATAAGLFQSAIGLALVLMTNAIAKKIDPESGIV